MQRPFGGIGTVDFLESIFGLISVGTVNFDMNGADYFILWGFACAIKLNHAPAESDLNRFSSAFFKLTFNSLA